MNRAIPLARRAVLANPWAGSRAPDPCFPSRPVAASPIYAAPHPTLHPQLTKVIPPAASTESGKALAKLRLLKPFLGKQPTQTMAPTFFFDAEPVCEPAAPALDACALCSKRLGRDSDIFMYRGDTPFCSEECRYEQMQLDAIRARQAARSGGRRQQYSAATESRRAQKVSAAS
jgi:hypothetical protein